MVKIGRQKTRPNTLVSPAPVGWRTLAEKVYCLLNEKGRNARLAGDRSTCPASTYERLMVMAATY